ncbi:cyclic nucleotide-binding domain-containing protein [Marivita sp. S6314]|uniref:cyclic nucleotide-binding domain-containing protein n=1 Tax=Marivita sp. S6314 TaxID=2926406 RepID=UPI001FF119F9|nr:cyclic nucleotide-binding domain-containing protein [Marivita sp. S6314]MCK0150523.1 cyclic nucleotide-binding domain-containing protein [Marivita sp. S6314]
MVTLFGGLLVAAMSCVLAISFTAIVYSGPLEVFLDRGIGMTLIACGVMAGIGSFLFSYRATVMHPQDITAVLLAAGASAIAVQGSGLSPDALFASIVVMMITASVTTGVVLILIGKLKLSYVVKFIPYPVLGGFLASTGYLLLIGSIGLVLRANVSVGDIPSLFRPDTVMVWLPWFLVSIGICAVTRYVKNGLVLPGCIALVCFGYYAWLLISGTSIAAARASGELLGPFSSGGFLTDIRPQDIFLADVSLVAGQALTILAVTSMAILGGALNLTGVELITKRRLNLNQDTTAMGVSTLVAAPAGGLLGFPALSNNILAYKLGLRGATTGLMVAVVSFGVAFFGASALEYLPRGLFAAVIGFLGIDLLYTWLWSERRRLNLRDYLIILLTVIVSATLGFLSALALGLIASVVLFIVSYAKQGIVRIQSNLSLRRSVVERGLAALDHLTVEGTSTEIIELTGYIFFGTASKLLGAVQSAVEGSQGAMANLLLDFSKVQGIDPSAVHSLQQIDEYCTRQGVDLYVSGLSAQDRVQVDRFLNGATLGKAVFATLDDALLFLEERVLAEAEGGATGAESFEEALLRDNPHINLEDWFPVVHVKQGDTFLFSGAPSNELLILQSGSAKVFVEMDDGTRTCVAQLLSGALVGEIGFFTNTRRTADVEAAAESVVVRISRDALQALLDSDPAFVASFHALAAEFLSRRLDRTTKLLSAAMR